eukprot:s950_g10.t1
MVFSPGVFSAGQVSCTSAVDAEAPGFKRGVWRRYKLRFSPEVHPADTTISRVAREMQKRMLCVYSIWKVKSLQFQLTTSQKKRKVGESLFVEEGEDEESCSHDYDNYLEKLLHSAAGLCHGRVCRGDRPRTVPTGRTVVEQCCEPAESAALLATVRRLAPQPNEVETPPERERHPPHRKYSLPHSAQPLMADLMAGPGAPLTRAFIACGWQCITVDWLLDPGHDLSDERRQRSLSEQLQDVHFIAAALDCSTKSRAREIPRVFQDGRPAPSPLRSEARPDGLPTLEGARRPASPIGQHGLCLRTG